MDKTCSWNECGVCADTGSLRGARAVDRQHLPAGAPRGTPSPVAGSLCWERTGFPVHTWPGHRGTNTGEGAQPRAGWTGSPRSWPGRALRAPCGQRAQGLRASWPGGLDSPARLAELGSPGGPGTVHPNSTYEPDPRPADPTHQHMDPASPSEPSTVRTRPPDWTKPGPPIGPGTVPPNPAHPYPGRTCYRRSKPGTVRTRPAHLTRDRRSEAGTT